MDRGGEPFATPRLKATERLPLELDDDRADLQGYTGGLISTTIS
jgi:hypothetical protein